jgi:signal transduction histidine kinase
LLFSVIDNGTGFDPEVSDPAGGLLKLSERIIVLGGTLTVRNEPAGGVAVRGMVPVAQRQAVTA